MLKNNDINIYANNLTEQVIKSSKIHTPNKFIKVKQSDPHWMNNNIKQMMRKRKRLYDKYKRTKNASDLQNFKQYRNKITEEIRKFKKAQTDKLAEKLRDTDLGSKDWWKTLETIYQTNFYISYPTSFQAGGHLFR